MFPKARILSQEKLNAMAEERRDKQDDDWSGYAGFGIGFVPSFLGVKQRYAVLANGWIRVGIYDTYEEASLVKAKLEYRRKEPMRCMIGLDGVS